MLGRFTKNESGIALPLAIGVMVIVGVMGAGLLTFVTTDLQSVAETNRGQKAFEMADAGVKAAKMQLASEPGNIADWTGASGKRLAEIDGNAVDVKIEPNTPSTNLYRVTSTGYSPADGTGAKRKVEAIFSVTASSSSTFPLGMFASGDVNISGKPKIRNMSLFSKKLEGKVITTAGEVPTFAGNDTFYGKWLRSPNTVERQSVEAGVGTEDKIEYEGPSTTRFGKIDYSKESSTKFKSPPGSGDITYPFNPDPTTQVDLAALEAKAKTAGNVYIESSGDVKLSEQLSEKRYPKPSTRDTVYYVKFTGGKRKFYFDDDSVTAGIKDCGQLVAPFANNCPQGTIVVENGDFVGKDQLGFKGSIIVRRKSGSGESLEFKSGNKFTLKGIVNVQGDMILESDSVYVAPELSEISPVLVGAGSGPELRGWRELYE